jgi:aspartyl-tRNA synthetase
MLAASKKAMKRRGLSVASEPQSSSNSMAAADSVDTAAAAAVGNKNMKWRMPQNQVDFILSWDVSDRFPCAPDNIDDMPAASDEFKERYRANQLRSAALMREISRRRREMQEFLKAQLEEHGYVDVETDSELFVQ